MRFSEAIDLFVADWRIAGRMRSDRTERSYRSILSKHAADVGNRDPRTIGREDVKRTLARWPNPNTQRCSRAVLVSFYDWAMEEGHRKDNPARQTRRPKRAPTAVYRMTLAEAVAFLDAATMKLERRAAYLGVCAGLRSHELRHLQAHHLQREGWIHVSADIAKGGRERWVPVITDLEPVVAEILADVAPNHYIMPGQHRGGYAENAYRREFPERPMSSQALQRMVHRIAKKAGIAAHIHPHLMRHVFADHIARGPGLRIAQALLGHADVGTTQGYVGAPTLDELLAAVQGAGFATPSPTALDPNDGEGGIRTRVSVPPSALADLRNLAFFPSPSALASLTFKAAT